MRVEERGKKLISGHNITDEQYDQMVFDREETEASLKAAIAAKDLADLNLSFTRITSPITGQIGRRMVDPGNLVRADETALTTVVSVDPIHAYFDMDERTLLQLRRLIQQGRIKSSTDSQVFADVALADEDNFSLRGTINFMDNQVESTTGTLRVRVVISNPSELLSPGLFVRIRIPVGCAAPGRAGAQEIAGHRPGTTVRVRRQFGRRSFLPTRQDRHAQRRPPRDRRRPEAGRTGDHHRVAVRAAGRQSRAQRRKGERRHGSQGRTGGCSIGHGQRQIATSTPQSSG